jgi:hypothetical protein
MEKRKQKIENESRKRRIQNRELAHKRSGMENGRWGT